MSKSISLCLLVGLALVLSTPAHGLTADYRELTRFENWAGNGVVSWDGPEYNDLIVRGDHAYAFGEYITTYDISDRQRPVRVGRTYLVPDENYAAAIGDFLFVMPGYQLYDISNPAVPTSVAESSTLSGTPVHAVGNRLYMGTGVSGSYGFQAVDVTTPTSPVAGTQLSLGAAVVGFDDFLYEGTPYLAVATGTSVRFYDLTNPDTPVLRANRALSFAANDIDVYGQQAYVATISGVVIVDISNLSVVPPILSTWIGLGSGYQTEYISIKVLDGVAHVASYSSRWSTETSSLWTVDITDPANPRTIAEMMHPEASQIHNLAGAGDLLCGMTDFGFFTVTVKGPEQPNPMVGELDVVPGLHSFDRPFVINGNRAYVAAGTTLHTLDLSDPVAPVAIGTPLTNPAFGRKMVTTGNWLFTANLALFDLTNPDAPLYVDYFNQNGRDVAIDGNDLYLAGGAGFARYDITNPASPVLLDSRPDGANGEAVALQGAYAYLAVRNFGIGIYDRSVPGTLQRVGTLATRCAMGLAVRGNYLYVADADSGLVVVDVHDPANPVRVGNVKVPGLARDVELDGYFIYVITGYGSHPGDTRYGGTTVQVLSAWDPADPRAIGTIPLPAPGTQATIANGHLYVTDSNGFRVFPLQCGPGECDVELPVYLQEFTITPAAGGVTLRWRIHGEDASAFHLTGHSEDRQWDVPYESTGLGSFEAHDAPPTESGREVTYVLLIDTENGLVELASETVSVGSLPLFSGFTRVAPNPFNPSTRLEYNLSRSGPVKVTIHDARGRLVACLLDGEQTAGAQSVAWYGTAGSGARLPSGVYFARLETAASVQSVKLLLAK